MKLSISITKVFFLFSISFTALADTGFQPGNILISSQNNVYEYNLDGELVSQTAIPSNAAKEIARDITVLDDGRLAVFNGTFFPELAIYDGISWQSMTINGWSTPNNGSYGGITSIANKVFVTDGQTAYEGEAKGLIAVDLTNNSQQRFIDSSDYMDISLGKDGLLYALKNVYGDVDVVDPDTLTVLRSVDLGHTSGSRGVAANMNGNIFMVSWNGYIAHYDADGVLLNLLSIGGNLKDINLDDNGRVIVGSRFGQAYLTDQSLSTFTEIVASTASTFVAFVPSKQPLASPELSGSSTRKGRYILTTLNWTTDANEVDIYYNGKIIENIAGTTTTTYSINKKVSQFFVVCNAGTLSCSDEYIANLRK